MATAEKGYLFENLRKVITLVDRLRDIGLHKYISLPRVAVLGTQSAGKSSLLEQIVGIDFLPRGSGVVTRRPLELRLVYVPKTQIEKPYGVFEEIGPQKFFDFQEVKKTIEVLTDKVAGNNKGIVDKPIILTIFSSTCPDLTLIDLPGITRIPIRGSAQTENIEKVTKDMAKRYCADPTTIILCVAPANQDMSTSDALLMARQLDPQGERTLGVITKIDIMDKGTNAKNMLLGNEVPLRLGFVGVVNRTNQDILDNKPVLKHLEDEKKYFSSHPVYSTMPSSYCGTSQLTKKVTEAFYHHIREFLPKLDVEMNKQLKEKETRLGELGTPLPETDKDKMQFLWRTVNEFITSYKTSIQGTYHKNNKLKQNNSIPIGSRIREVLTDLYSEYNSKKVCDVYTDKDIYKAMQLHEGDSIPGFPSIDSFLSLLVPQLKRLKDPAFDCINEVYMYMEELAVDILDIILEKLPNLKNELQESILATLSKERDRTRDVVDDLLESEINYVFTNDQAFVNGGGFKRNKKLDTTNKPQQNPMIGELRNRIDAYFDSVIRSIRDSVPKMIGNFLVKASQENLRFTLFETVNKSEHFFQFMKEPVYIVEERQALRKTIETMKNAKQTIKRDPDLSHMFKPKMTSLPKLQEAPKSKAVPSNAAQSRQNNNSNQQQQQQQQPVNNNNVQSSSNSNNQSQQQKQSSMQSLFGTPAPAKPNPPANNNSNQPLNNNNNNNRPANNSNSGFGNMFGNPPPQNNNNANKNMNMNNNNNNSKPAQNAPLQPKQSKVDDAIDSGVDKMMANQKVQDGMKNAANKGMYAAVDSKVPIKDKNGNNPVASFMGKQAEKAVASESVQNEMKGQMKSQAKEQKKRTFW